MTRMLSIALALKLGCHGLCWGAKSNLKLEARCEQVFLTKQEQLQTQVKWQNGVNTPFFESIPASIFIERASLCGMESTIDLNMIQKELASAIELVPRDRAIVFEIGGGYGRIAMEMRRRFPNIELYVFEHAPSYAQKLRTIFENDNRTTVVGRSFLHRPVYRRGRIVKADVIMLMWSTILEFSPAELPILMKRIKNLLTSEGIVVIDMPLAFSSYKRGIVQTDEKMFGEEISHDLNGNIWRGFMPSQELFKFLLDSSGFKTSESITYVPWSHVSTSFSSERFIYILGQK